MKNWNHLLKNWIDPEGERGPSGLGRSQEVRQAGQHHEVGLLSKSLEQERDWTSWDRLCSGHQRAIVAVHRVHVPLYVGVTDDGKLL